MKKDSNFKMSKSIKFLLNTCPTKDSKRWFKGMMIDAVISKQEFKNKKTKGAGET